MTSSGAGDFDLSALPEEDRGRVQQEIDELKDSNREFSDQDITPGDTGSPTSN